MMMKNNYLFVLLLVASSLSAQQLYQHPVLLLLGTDLSEMGDINTGLNAYDGMGSSDLLLAHSLQEGRRIGLSWIPANGLPNGWGLLQIQQNNSRYVSVSGSDKGGYDAVANIAWDTHQLGAQHTVFKTQGNQRLADQNRDGFRDQVGYRTYNFQHQLLTYVNNFELRAYGQYFGQRQHGGEIDYDWREQAGSDSIYGFGSKTNHWIGGLSAKRSFRRGRNLHVNANWRLQEEDANYGQRRLMTHERRTGVAVNYRHEHQLGLSNFYSFYQRQKIQQSWDDWSFNPNWNRLAFGGHHRRFLTTKFMLEGSLSLDYHTAAGWQLLPNLRIDYQLHKKIRLGLLGGRNYRWQQPTTALQPYLLSQREFLPESYGPDRLWYLGALLQSSQLNLGPLDMTYKVVYQARRLSEQLLIDPANAGELLVYHRSVAGPWQHLLLLTAQAKIKNITTSMVYRWRDKRLVPDARQGQAFFESRHSLLAQVSYQKNFNRKLQGLSLSTDYLLQSPQRLPNEAHSPYLHHWRSQLDLQWKIPAKKSWRTTTFMGVENLLNQQQDELFVAADQPFSSNFDGSNRWGDTVGRRLYAGLKVGF